VKREQVDRGNGRLIEQRLLVSHLACETNEIIEVANPGVGFPGSHASMMPWHDDCGLGQCCRQSQGFTTAIDAMARPSPLLCADRVIAVARRQSLAGSKQALIADVPRVQPDETDVSKNAPIVYRNP
jgi:hypothetical protein